MQFWLVKHKLYLRKLIYFCWAHILWARQNDRVKHKYHLLLSYEEVWGASKARDILNIIYYHVILLFIIRNRHNCGTSLNLLCLRMCVWFLIPFRISVIIANNWYQMTLNSKAKFEVGKFDETENFKLWQRWVKDLLAQ